ncbi:AAA family ATPase [Aquabacterium sp.]|uniref:AAA family ATPase n=1 Tax=Aquabacterium sp. TaxID=1872578 RepID=UPI002C5D5B65|nr:AAA family ATPase [Aquabacterium sp.]HSW07193.1 AAA family ATPase [Aquabacterium sp.]
MTVSTTPPGWQLETVRRDAEFVLYRLRDPAAAEARLAKAPAVEHAGSLRLGRLEHELDLKADLDPQWAVCPLELIRWDGRPLLLLADPGGEPLDGLLGQPMALTPFLRIASAWAAALGQLHERGIVHKDIKPANVLFDAMSGQVHLMGFGIATRQPRERQALASPEDVAGTLAYMAPEQTGRMTRSIDSRSDLYALGVSFYEMVTGGLPFTTTDPMALCHSHIARQPAAPTEHVPGLPEPVSAIVMKLLAKAADDRYQTAFGLEADLRRCLAQWETQARIDAFPVALHDVSAQLLIPEKLYGRKAEVEVLVRAFDRVAADGLLELVLVSGYSGIGKSSIVGELHKLLVQGHGLFASGKFDQYKRDIPCATLAQAFGVLVRQILGQSEAQLSRWRDAIRAAVGSSGQLVVQLIPELELIIGRQPPVQELSPQDAQSRFQTVFRRLLGVFAQPEHPLVLFLDDLQWLDAATLRLLEQWTTEPELRHLLLIGAYRDNEVDALHPLMRTLDAIRGARQVRVQEIALAAFTPDEMAQFVADTLHCTRDHAQGLAQLVQERTGGNPFFAIQFVSALVEQRLLAVDPVASAWTWDLDHIRAKGFTDNVVDLMIDKLKRLPAVAQEALKVLGCLGSSAAVVDLCLIRGATEAQIHVALWAAVRGGLVYRSDGGYTFLHDRIQEAAYSLIPDTERASEHLRIGRLLASRTAAQEFEQKIFEIVNPFNRGIALITAPAERERLAELNLIAGQRAKDSAAHAAALKYLATGGDLLPQDSWERRYELSFALAFHRAECEYLTGDLAAAEAQLSALAQRCTNPIDLAAVTCVQVNLYTTMDRSDRAVEAGLAYLRQVQVQWLPHPTRDDVRAEFERMFQCLGERSIEALIDLPLMTDADSHATMDVLTAILPPVLFTDENLLGLVVGRMANISLVHGHSDGSCLGYAWLGMFLGPRFGHYAAGYRFGQLGLDLVDQRGLSRFKPRVYLHVANVVNPWTQPFRSGRAWIRRAFDVANEGGDLTFAVYSCNHLITNLLASEEPLTETLREAESGLAFARKARFGLVVDILIGQLQLIRSLRGAAPGPADAPFDEAAFERHLTDDPRLAIAACWYWVRKLQACFLAGEGDAAVEAAGKAAQLLWTSPSHIEVAEYHFFAALARAGRCDEAPVEDREPWLATLRAHHAQLAQWAENCHENFDSRAALVGAEIARLEGRDLDAIRHYEASIRSARDNAQLQTEGVAHELAAAFHRARGATTAARAHLDEARAAFARWGAEGKVRQLDARHLQLRGPPAPTFSPALGGVGEFDLLSVAKASQAISGRIVLDELVDTLLRIVIENAGAQTGHLLLVRDGHLWPAAEAHVQQHEVQVQLQLGAADEETALPQTILNYVRRSKASVLLSDAAQSNPFSTDPRLAERRSKSVLCLPITRQSTLIGLLYLENNLVTHAFTAERLAVLELLAAQAAISLENALLYADLQQENLERRRAEASLRERDGRIRRLVESNIIGVLFWNRAGDITEANDAFLSLVGYSRQDLLQGAVRWTDMTPADYRAADARAAEELRRTGLCAPYEKAFICQGGRLVPVLLGCAFLEGSQEHGVAFVLDLTERKQVEAERQARRVADLANRAKSIFLTTMSHELRTPLNAILGFAQLLLAEPQLDEHQARRVKIIQQGGEQLLTLVNDILDLSRIEAGKVDLQPQALALDEFLRTVIDIIRIRAEEKGLQFNFDGVPGLARAVIVDEKYLRQILLNLLSNAVKFTGQGQVSLRARHLGVSDTVASLRFEVEDTGIGISPDELESVFMPFEQGADAQRRFGGTGLGLSISRQLVRLMGGDIQVESRLGQGSRFWFDLDLPLGMLDAKRDAMPHRPPITGYRGERRTLLVVDDVEANRTLLVDFLTALGFNAVEADNGEAGLRQAQALRPDLIVMDSVMPVMDGLESTRRLRQVDELKNVPVIAVSASASAVDERMSLAGGADAFLAKPIQLDKLLHEIGRLLQLAWVPDMPGTAAPVQAQAPGRLIPPPPQEMKILYGLAQTGNMRTIRAHADFLGTLGVTYGPFARRLRELADGYQSQAILELLRAYMDREDHP